MSNEISHDLDVIKNTTVEEIAGAEKIIANAMVKIANKLGAYDLPVSWEEFVAYVKTGRIAEICPAGTKIEVDKESGVSTTIHGGITAASVNEETFLSAIAHTGTAAYEFTYDGAVWMHEGEPTELTLWGITYTGTPQEGDLIVVHVQADKIEFTAVGIDYDVAANSAIKHTLSLLTTDCLLYGSIPFCSPQKLVHAAAAIPAGTYNITLDHGAYGGGTAEDGTYQFTITQPIPAGGGIRHAAMGSWSGSEYSTDRICASTFTTYDASYNVIESNIACSLGNDGTSLGTTSASNPTYRTSDDLNFTERNAYGSNRNAHSANRKWLNSDAPEAASGAIASWWTASDKFDMPVRSTLPGFLHGIDPSFRGIIQPVRKRTALCIADGYGYEDTVETIWQPSMAEMNFGQNNGVTETSPKADGTLNKTTPLDFYVGAGNTDRIKVHNGTARYWWLRSPHPSFASSERYVYPDGALNDHNAYYAHGVVAGLVVG